MATNVYANDNEICSKAAKGKSTASFPDPCWSPPPPPAGPIVLPYLNTARAKTLKKGTKTVLIKNTMVAKKNISFFAKSSGNEPATKAFQKGVLTRTIQGKAYFITWSQNVKFEGKGVARHNDKMTHNHGSMMGNTPPNGYRDTSEPVRKACKKQLKNIKQQCDQPGDPKEENAWMKRACEKLQVKPRYPLAKQETIDNWVKEGKKSWEEINRLQADLDNLTTELTNYNQTYIGQVSSDKVKNDVGEQTNLSNKTTIIMSDLASQNSCITARRCILRTYSKTESPEGGQGCCPGQTGHHLIPSSVGCQCSQNYKENDAPTICAEGVSNVHGTHGQLHEYLDDSVKRYSKSSKKISYQKVRNMSVNSAMKSFPDAKCSKKCFAVQLDEHYEKMCGNTLLEPKSGKGGGGKHTNTSAGNNLSNGNKNKR